MARAVGSIILQNASLDLVLLPIGSRTPPTITLTASAAAANDTTIDIAGETGDTQTLNAGASFSFEDTANNRRVQVVLDQDVTLTEDTPVAAAIFPLKADVPVGATATFIDGVLPMEGLQSFDLSTSDTSVDTTDTKSGSGTEVALIRASKTVNCSFIIRPNNRAFFELVQNVALKGGGFYGREVYATLTLPDGERKEGAALIQNYQEPGNQNEVRRASFDLVFQGDSFTVLSGYTYAP